MNGDKPHTPSLAARMRAQSGDGAPTHQFNAHGYTICTTAPLDSDEQEALTAYLGLLRKSQDRKRGIVNLDADPTQT